VGATWACFTGFVTGSCVHGTFLMWFASKLRYIGNLPYPRRRSLNRATGIDHANAQGPATVEYIQAMPHLAVVRGAPAQHARHEFASAENSLPLAA
jgi:hypothetical protein